MDRRAAAEAFSVVAETEREHRVAAKWIFEKLAMTFRTKIVTSAMARRLRATIQILLGNAFQDLMKFGELVDIIVRVSERSFGRRRNQTIRLSMPGLPSS